MLNSCNKDNMVHKIKIFTIWPFAKKFTDPNPKRTKKSQGMVTEASQ